MPLIQCYIEDEEVAIQTGNDCQKPLDGIDGRPIIHLHYAPELKNVKLRLHSVGILQYYCYTDFMWNQILANPNGQKMSFLAIVEVLNISF